MGRMNEPMVLDAVLCSASRQVGNAYPRKYVVLHVFIATWYAEPVRKASEIEMKFWCYGT